MFVWTVAAVSFNVVRPPLNFPPVQGNILTCVPMIP